MMKWIVLLTVSIIATSCGNTDQTASNEKTNGSEKAESDYHLRVRFLSYNANEKTYELEVTDIIGLPAAPIEVIAEGDVIQASDHDNTNQLRNKVLMNPPNEPFEAWIFGRPSMSGTEWIIRKYEIE